jgi:hypothetical protein
VIVGGDLIQGGAGCDTRVDVGSDTVFNAKAQSWLPLAPFLRMVTHNLCLVETLRDFVAYISKFW